MRTSAAIPFLFGLLLLAALVGAVLQFGQIERFLALMTALEPSWLIACLVLQAGTYLCEAIAWRLALRQYACELPLPTLVPLSIAKLFSDQVMPSGGISGNAFFVVALRRRGVAQRVAMSCMLVDLGAYFLSYVSMTLASSLVLAVHDELSRWLLALTAAFVAIQAGLALLLWHVRRRRRSHRHAPRFRHPRLQAWMSLLQSETVAPPNPPALLVQLAGLHAAIMLLDAGSLWMLLRGIGQAIPFELAFTSFVTASMVMSLSPIPLGLGSFETACVGMLHSAGISLEAGLTAAILFRGMTAWLPMLPGIWLIKHEMLFAKPPGCATGPQP